MAIFYSNVLPPTIPDDGGDGSTPSQPDDGDGDYDGSSDPIPSPDIPNFNLNNFRATAIYELTTEQASQLFSYLYSADFYDVVVKLWQSPMENLQSLHYLPIADIPSVSSEVVIAKIPTGVTANRCTEQFIKIDCGTLDVKEFFGTFLDYSPNTKLGIKIPYCGTHSIDVDYFMGGKIGLQYIVDIYTGQGLCFITAQKNYLNSVIYTFNCDFASRIPLSGKDYGSMLLTAGALIGGATVAIASGITAPVVAGAVVGGASALINAKPQYQQSGNYSGNVGEMDVKTPYLFITRPIENRPENYADVVGNPANIWYELSQLSGFAKISNINLSNIPAPPEVVNDIKQTLQGGVFF